MSKENKEKNQSEIDCQQDVVRNVVEVIRMQEWGQRQREQVFLEAFFFVLLGPEICNRRNTTKGWEEKSKMY